MNTFFSLPADTNAQIASTTSGLIVNYAGPAYIIIGVLLTFFIIELVIGSFQKTPTTDTNGGS